MDVREIVSWLGFAFRALVSLGVIGAALVVVRPKLPRAGWALAAAAAVDTLMSCCSRAMWRGVRELEYESMEAAFAALGALEIFETFLVGALVIAVLVLLARDAKAAPPRA